MKAGTSQTYKEDMAEPTRQMICWRFHRYMRLLLFRTIHDVAPMLDRASGRGGKPAQPAGSSTASR
jgi:hypothetical protein